MCILISFNGIYHFIVKCTNHSFLTWGSPKIPNHWWLTWKILECELNLLKSRNIFFYFPLPFPGIALYDPVCCFFVLFCSCFANTFTWRLCQIDPFITYFEEGKAERKRHRKKAHLTAALAPVQQDQCLVFPHIHLNDIFEAERAVTG